MERDASPCLYTLKEGHWQVNATLGLRGKRRKRKPARIRRSEGGGWLVG